MREKTRMCRVCGSPCSGTVCRACYTTKNNKHAGRYKSYLETAHTTNIEYTHSRHSSRVGIKEVGSLNGRT